MWKFGCGPLDQRSSRSPRVDVDAKVPVEHGMSATRFISSFHVQVCLTERHQNPSSKQRILNPTDSRLRDPRTAIEPSVVPKWSSSEAQPGFARNDTRAGEPMFLSCRADRI